MDNKSQKKILELAEAKAYGVYKALFEELPFKQWKGEVFISMPYDKNLEKVYHVLRNLCVDCSLMPVRVDKLVSNKMIITEIMEGIDTSNIIIADISGHNPNVFHEIGIAQVLNKELITTDNTQNIPFNLKTWKCIEYNNNDLSNLQKKVKVTLQKILSKSKFSPPSEDMVFVPAGIFLYGPDNQKVFLFSFYMDKYLVINEQYKKFVDYSGIKEPDAWKDSRFAGTKQPVVGLTYKDIQAFAKWSGKFIPTEQQWEKAARGNDGRIYPWGNKYEETFLNINQRIGCVNNIDNVMNISPYGCYDMLGNAWEWTSTSWEGDDLQKVIRGGGWASLPREVNCYTRQKFSIDDSNLMIGFRLASYG